MVRKLIIAITVSVVFVAFIIPAISLAAPLDNVKFIKIAPNDEKAVVKMPDGKLQVIKPGDAIAEGVTVKEIARGRIVLEEKNDKGLETVIVRMEAGTSRVERLRKQPESRPVLVAPAKSEK